LHKKLDTKTDFAIEAIF